MLSAPPVKLDNVEHIGIFDAIFYHKKKSAEFSKILETILTKQFAQIIHQLSSIFKRKTNETIVDYRLAKYY